jgi:chitinase
VLTSTFADEYGQWSSTAGPNAALDDSCAPSQAGSAKSAVNAWMTADKLVLGVASYGRAFSVSAANAYTASVDTSNTLQLATSSATSINQQLALYPAFNTWTVPAGEAAPTECGASVAQDKQFTFSELIDHGYLTANGTVAAGYASTFDDCSQTPFLYDDKQTTYVSYDDARSFAAKGTFLRSAGLRGFAIWEASGDRDDILLDAIRAAAAM